MIQPLPGIAGSSRFRLGSIRLASSILSANAQAIFVKAVSDVLDVNTAQVAIEAIGKVNGTVDVTYVVSYASISLAPSAQSVYNSLVASLAFLKAIETIVAASNSSTRNEFFGLQFAAPIVRVQQPATSKCLLHSLLVTDR